MSCERIVDTLVHSQSLAVTSGFMEVRPRRSGHDRCGSPAAADTRKPRAPRPWWHVPGMHLQGIKSAWLRAQVCDRLLMRRVEVASLPISALRYLDDRTPLSLRRLVLLYVSGRPAAKALDELDSYAYLLATLLLAYLAYRRPDCHPGDRELVKALPKALVALLTAYRQQAGDAAASHPHRGRTMATETAAARSPIPPWSESLQVLFATAQCEAAVVAARSGSPLRGR